MNAELGILRGIAIEEEQKNKFVAFLELTHTGNLNPTGGILVHGTGYDMTILNKFWRIYDPW